MPTAIVSGVLANKPFNGGEAWVRLSWALGLRRLGFDVYFVEELAAANCVTESGEPADFASCANRAYFESVVGDFGLAERAGLLHDGGRESSGLGLSELGDLAAGADLLVDISGHLTVGEILTGPRTRLYVDLDPGFTQAWHADRRLGFTLGGHDRYATVGLNVGAPIWPIPSRGIEWIPTLPPVLLDEWPSCPPAPGRPRLTTVATWRSPYGPLEIEGRAMGSKHHEFRRLIELPERLERATFELALDIHPGDSADLEALRAHGWEVVDPRDVAATPGAFRDYVRRSSAEFSVAQGVYAESSSGWFSDRTAAYLASGRPAVVQETGIEGDLAPHRGLLPFGSLTEAVARADEAIASHAEQCRAARSFAVEYLDSDRVLGRLLERIGVDG
jgi:hypothetical protein